MPVFNITSAKPSVSEYAAVLWENAKANGGDYFNPDYCKTENDTVTYTAAEQGTIADVKKNIKKTGILDKFNYRCSETEESLEYKIVFDNCSVEDIWVKASLSGGTVTVTAKKLPGRYGKRSRVLHRKDRPGNSYFLCVRDKTEKPG